MQKNKIPISAALIALVKSLHFLEHGTDNVEVTVDLDDSIIEDTNTTVDRNIKLTTNGLRSKITAIMEINKCSEGEAKKELARIAEDNNITGQDIDWTDMGNDDADEQDDEGNDVDDESSEEPESGGDNR